MRRIVPFAIVCFAAAASCAPKPDAPAPPEVRKEAAAKAAAAAPAAKEVVKIVFVDQAEACECTMKRIAGSWAALTAALGDPPRLPVERIHLDTEQEKADVYDELRSLVVPPGIYFLDEKEALVEMLQGEVTAEQIAAVLAPKPSAAAHDPTHPPIDCPLRKAGVDPNNLRPFDDVEKYIAFLERPDRAVWQKPDQVVAALALTGKEIVVDLGAGSGYFTFRLAKALPQGKVVAADTEPEMIRHIHHKLTTEGVRNVEASLIKPEDPGIPADADLVFVCDVLHHVPDRAAWLDKVAAEMHPGAKLVLIEFKEGNLPEGPPESVKITRAQMVELAVKAGLSLDSERADLLPYQTFLVFRKAS
jgi:SAM-dependent methyltransferase